ncbi:MULTISPECIES: DUF1329 domain-containing protein [Pseudomonas]|uniref:DUF1329 domain-containing protein n=1 Tax=Pseudomonas neustonica TaxID=2487346 RepID=A0ABX9XHW3_9PSED|nr:MULTISPECIES: DUF1329 domain-containing protein [Pseudomonas]MAB23779.1 outer membrane lipoprotein-sorting protein [Pseudomonadales bacterium]MBA6421018.1 DUF1329 domain-containing protein [Pseudomonas sp. 5Ae-yellow]ROZ82760.1 DUF1329 domain-containing protein [Pseudomonas sp. SSM44]ROZ84712.1 DUF1329 domain-containing protein [Pseudomonas neustonica]
MKSIRKLKLQTMAMLALSSLALSVSAAVTPDKAATLQTTLTPLGAERAGNASGTIPEWTGGMATDAAAVDEDGFYGDPFAGEQPQYVVTAANMEQYKDMLTDGQKAMLSRYPETYKLRVFQTRRSATVPQEVFAAAARNAVNTKLASGGNGLENFDTAYPFPIPESGVEVIWNHITRYRGGSFTRTIAQATPQANGSNTYVVLQDAFSFATALTDYGPKISDNLMFYFTQRVLSPSRLAGDVLLVHENIDQVKEPRAAWLYNAGQRRVRRAPQVAYDGPALSADGTRVSDNYDLYNGSPDRYEWKLVGKRELLIPYNNFAIAKRDVAYDDIIQKGHINQDMVRYEVHRVWEVEANLREGQRHIYARRHFFIDEDNWQAGEIDHYDGRGGLWRIAEAMALQRFDKQVPGYAIETLYDLQSGRYMALGMTNEERKNYDFSFTASSADFTPNALRASGIR